MVGGKFDNGIPVVRYWQNSSAPTGEGTMIDTADGGLWQHVLAPTPPQTGERRGVLHNNKVYPKE
jgi:hypothetical protein